MPGPAAGFFGKLPSAGDFVQRRLPADFVDTWDSHFEGAVAHSRSALGADWHDAYHASPAWRFMLSAGVCGESPWAGLMAPGVDRVGRCFPMVIAAPIASGAPLAHAQSWFEAAEQLHADAQADATVKVDDFDARVLALPAMFDGAPRASERPCDVDWSAADHWRMLPPPAAVPTEFLDALWSQLAAAPGSWCLWWTTGAARVPATVLATRGLPQPAAYTALLDARHGSAWRSPAAEIQSVPPPAGQVWDDLGIDLAPTGDESWLPDEREDTGSFTDTAVAVPPVVASPLAPAGSIGATTVVASTAPVAVGTLQDAGSGWTVLAAETASHDLRQHAINDVLHAAQEARATGWQGGMSVLRTRLLALQPALRRAGEDLIDPVAHDCAVLVAQLAGGRASVLRIGVAAAWHWRQGQLQTLFGEAAPAATGSDPAAGFDDLLFNGIAPAPAGLGAAGDPVCDEAGITTAAGDRLLLLATPVLAQLAPQVIAGSLALASCAEAGARIALAAGLGSDPAQWPLAIIEVSAC